MRESRKKRKISRNSFLGGQRAVRYGAYFYALDINLLLKLGKRGPERPKTRGKRGIWGIYGLFYI